MPDQEDDAELARRRRDAAVRGLLERAEHLEVVLVRSPELQVLFDPRTDRGAAAEAKVRSAIRDYTELGDDVMARRLEKALKRPTKPGVKPKWGEKLSPENMERLMSEEIVAQPRPNVSTAAKAVVAREPDAVTDGAVRQEWNKIAKERGFKSGAERARRIWQEARARDEPSA